MDYIAAILELYAVWIIGNKNKFGFVIAMLGNFFWIAHVIHIQGSYGLLLVSPIMFVINVRNYMKWS